MARDSGRYPVASPRAYNEEKSYLLVVAQGPGLSDVAQPLHSKDFNDAQQIFQKLVQRTAAVNAGTGAADPDFMGFKPLPFTDNKPSFGGVTTGANDPQSVLPYFYVNGLPVRSDCSAGQFDWDSTVADCINRIHRKCSTYVLNVIGDTTARYKVNELAGRLAYILLNDNSWGGPYTIASNTVSTVTVVGGPAVVDVAAGNAYRIDPSTSVAERVDTVWLDTWLEEIAATAVAGDPFVDAALNINIGGTPIEPTRRMQLRQALFIEQDAGDASNYVDATGSCVLIEDPIGTVRRYTDAAGISHTIVPVGQYTRFPLAYSGHAGADCAAEYITDLRTPSAIARHSRLAHVVSALHKTGIISGYAATRTSATVITIASGEHMSEGVMYSLDGIATDRPTDGTSSAWADTTYYVVIDTSQRIQVRTSAASGNECPLWKFTVAAGALPTFTEGSTYEDYRRFVGSYGRQFQVDTDGYFRAVPIWRSGGGSFLPSIVSPSLGSTVTLAGSSGTSLLLRGLSSSAKVLAGAAGTTLTVGSSSEQIAIKFSSEATNKIEVLGNFTTVVDANTNGPQTWEFHDTRHDSIITQGVTFGVPLSGASPISGEKYFVPMSDGHINAVPASYLSSWGFMAMVNDWLQVMPAVTNSGDFSSYFIDAAYADPEKAFFTLPLGIPKGMNIVSAGNKIRVFYACALGGASPVQKFRIDLAYRDTITAPRTGLTIVASSAEVTLTGNDTGNHIDIDPSTFVNPNARARWYLLFRYGGNTGGSGAADNDRIHFYGATMNISLAGIGDNALESTLAYPFEGMHV